MNNPTTIDMRDVAEATDPIGRQGYVEEVNKVTTDVPADATNPARPDQLRAEGRRPISTQASRSAH